MATDLLDNADFPTLTADPATPDPDFIRVYGRRFGNRRFLTTIDEYGVERPMQGFLGLRQSEFILPTTGTSVSAIGNAFTVQGTASTPALATTNFKTATRRTTFATNGVLGGAAGIFATIAGLHRNIGGKGGFMFSIVVGLEVMVTGNRGFFGLRDIVTTPTNFDPLAATTPGRIGIGCNLNTGSWSLVNNLSGSAPTVLALPSLGTLNTTDLIALTIDANPVFNGVGYTVANLSTGIQVQGTLTANIPNPATFLAMQAFMSNNNTLASCSFSLANYYADRPLL